VSAAQHHGDRRVLANRKMHCSPAQEQRRYGRRYLQREATALCPLTRPRP
jgi:hypothetical protein